MRFLALVLSLALPASAASPKASSRAPAIPVIARTPSLRSEALPPAAARADRHSAEVSLPAAAWSMAQGPKGTSASTSEAATSGSAAEGAGEWSERFDNSSPSAGTLDDIFAALPPAPPAGSYRAPPRLRVALNLSRAGKQATKAGAVSALAAAAPVTTGVGAVVLAAKRWFEGSAAARAEPPVALQASRASSPPGGQIRAIERSLAVLAGRSGSRRPFTFELAAEGDAVLAAVDTGDRLTRASTPARYVFSSAFLEALSPRELAGTLAHEHAHVAMGDEDDVLPASRLAMWGVPLAAAEWAVGAATFGYASLSFVDLDAAFGLLVAGGLLAGLSMLLTYAWQRAVESRADDFAAWLTTPALVEEALAPLDDGKPVKRSLLDTHPPLADRLSALRAGRAP